MPNAAAHAPPAALGVTVHFKDVGVELRSGKGTQHLLKDVTGVLLPGQMTALMGPSGSGKTTLLDVLSGRKTSGLVTGQVLYNDRAATPCYLRTATGYVEQHLTLLSDFTVKEMLLYTAELKRPWSEPRSKKLEVVQQLLEDLNLTACADVMIGDPMNKGISGGQAKRVSIGVSMVCVPPVLYLDEPTSGLDSQSAVEIMSAIRMTTLDSTTVAVAIHSPGPEVFAMFDTALVLARGHLIYTGPTGPEYATGVALAASPWLRDVTTSTPLPDLLLKAASMVTQSSDGEQVEALATALRSTRLVTHMQADLCKAGYDREHSTESSFITVHVNAVAAADAQQVPQDILHHASTRSSLSRSSSPQASSGVLFWPLALLLMLKHRARRHWIRWSWHLPRTVDKVVLACVIVSFFVGQGSKTGSGAVMPQTSSLFMWAAMCANMAYAFIACVFIERPLYYRERADGLYTPLTYLLFKAVTELAPLVVLSFFTAPFTFFLVQYQGSFFLYWLTFLVLAWTTITFAFTIVAYSPHQDIAIAACALLSLAMYLTAGIFITVSNLPVYWRWFAWVSPVRYANMALLLNQYEGNDFIATADGQKVTQWLEVSGNKWLYEGIVGVIGVGFFLVAWLGFTCTNHSKR